MDSEVDKSPFAKGGLQEKGDLMASAKQEKPSIYWGAIILTIKVEVCFVFVVGEATELDRAGVHVSLDQGRHLTECPSTVSGGFQPFYQLSDQLFPFIAVNFGENAFLYVVELLTDCPT